MTLVGVTEGFQKIRNLVIVQGRFFDDMDIDSSAKACLITQDLAKALNRDMVGEVIRVGDLRFLLSLESFVSA